MARGQSQCPPCSRPLPRLVSSPQGMELAAGARAWFQVKARHARALSRGWMVSSPQGMELATVAMAFAIRLQPTVLAPFPRLDGVKPAGGLLARGLQSSRMVSSPQVGYWREDCSQAGWCQARRWATGARTAVKQDGVKPAGGLLARGLQSSRMDGGAS
ncbi:hypothetical protein CHLRE_11g483450v5 [Chlamydomonas reinhardtii]|uniref:Uncharacterized protein n=1 Tax=Chlamydomonas reinhardtii TaxID=3055 RepID=A0A2K3D8X7_CHLRE|nr:uncharacterized protein CHLRE_11g483450v5 [Chlamydomonas reinhardtii]PNW76977.1 hypothetical protein CHLRE_11g483450v5 [Chlamydomonas reinhardtii]